MSGRAEPGMAGKVKSEQSLSGRRVFIVEDESLVTMLIEDALADIGCEVAGIASNLEEAAKKASSLDFDVAIIDVNLHGKQTYTLADDLTKRSIPFVFSTGYGAGEVEKAYPAVPTLEKPFQENDLVRALSTALGTPFD